MNPAPGDPQRYMEEIMNQATELRYVINFAKRSAVVMYIVTILYACGTLIYDIVFKTDEFHRGIPYWLWVPFCFFTIPFIFYLSRAVQNLHNRVKELEEKNQKTI
jgi:hypothetical protein